MKPRLGSSFLAGTHSTSCSNHADQKSASALRSEQSHAHSYSHPADAMSMLAVGTLAGAMLVAITSGFVRRFLYDTSPLEISVAFSALLILVAVAILGAWLPALRAAGIDPMQA